MRSMTYERVSRRFVAQLDDRKYWILWNNPKLGIPFFEPGGRRFESVRARVSIKHLRGRVFDDPCYYTALCY